MEELGRPYFFPGVLPRVGARPYTGGPLCTCVVFRVEAKRAAECLEGVLALQFVGELK